MRKIEQVMLGALAARQTRRSGNTAVSITPGTKDDNFAPIRGEVFLHGNHIATMDYRTGALMVNRDTLRRWPTPTTKSRLRALGADVATKNHVTYLDGKPL